MPLKSWSEMMKDAETNTSGFEPLEPGSYSFVIDKPAEVGTTQKGHPKFTINPMVESGPRQNARIFHRFNGSDSAYANKNYFFAPMYAIGLTPSFFQSEPSDEAIANAFQGKRFSARVSLVKGQDGVERPELSDFGPAVGGPPAGGNQPGVPQGLPQASTQPAGLPQPAPVAQAAPAAPAQTQAPAAPATPVQSQPPVDDGNPWAAAPPPPPAW